MSGSFILGGRLDGQAGLAQDASFVQVPPLVRVKPRDQNWSSVGSAGIITFVEGYGWIADLNPGGLLQLALVLTYRGPRCAVRIKNVVNANITQQISHFKRDGIIIPFAKAGVHYLGSPQGSGNPKLESGAIIKLPDVNDTDWYREHTLYIVWTSDPINTARFDVYGLDLDPRAGYIEEPIFDRRTTAQGITSTAVQIPQQVGQTPSHLITLATVSKLELTNPGGTQTRAIQVTLPANNWNTGGSSTFTAGSVPVYLVPPNAVVPVDLGGNVSPLGITVQDLTGGGSYSANAVAVGRMIS
jgi:hypothetical protein